MLLLLHAACNLLALVHALIYSILAIKPGLPPQTQGLLISWATAATIAAYAIGTPLLIAIVGPVRRALDGIFTGHELSAENKIRSRRRALNLPDIQSRISSMLWIGSAATLPLFNAYSGAGFPFLLMVHCILVAILVGSVSTTFIYYSVEWYSRVHLIPILIPDGAVSEIPGTRPVTINFKILVLLLTTCVLPIAILTVAFVMDTTSLTIILYIVISFLLIGVAQGAFISTSISSPVERLTAAMLNVKRNNFLFTIPVVSVDQIGLLSEGFNRMVKGLQQAEFVKETFGRYVTRQVLDEILSGKVHLGGELRMATVLFCDIRGFTAIAEKLQPGEVVGFLNQYLDIMVEVLVDEGGTIDKFIGDAIMASFGVPVSATDDALRAVRAAVAMKERLAVWNREREKMAKPLVEIGIGLHTGWVIAGNIGSSRKLEYTIIGDTVNTSSRIEQLNKHFRTTLLISAQTHELIAEYIEARRMEPVAVKGKQDPITVYEVIGLRPPDSVRAGAEVIVSPSDPAFPGDILRHVDPQSA